MEQHHKIIMELIKMQMDKITIFFSKLFSNIILQNKIVATVLYNISKQLVVFKNKLDVQLNNDI